MIAFLQSVHMQGTLEQEPLQIIWAFVPHTCGVDEALNFFSSSEDSSPNTTPMTRLRIKREANLPKIFATVQPVRSGIGPSPCDASPVVLSMH